MQVFGIGTAVVDHVVRLARFPDRDTKQTVERHWKQVGGPVPVALSTAAFYGTPTTFLSRWGDDEAGRYIGDVLSQRGVDVKLVELQPDWSTGFSHVWTEATDGTRTIACFRGEFTLPDEQTVAIPAVSESIRHCEILHLDGWAPEAAIAAAKQMKQQQGIVVLDAGSFKPRMEELFPLVDVLIASSLFRKSRFDNPNASIEQLLDLGCQQVITTNGQQDAFFSDGTDTIRCEIPDVDVVDSNGAGDIFSGAILHSISRGWKMDKALSFAVQVASHSCGQDGNSRHVSIGAYNL